MERLAKAQDMPLQRLLHKRLAKFSQSHQQSQGLDTSAQMT